MSTFNCMFQKMWVYIFACMIINSFQYSLCSLSNIIFRTISFMTCTMVNNIGVMFVLCFILHLKASAKLVLRMKATFVLMLLGNKVFIIFFMDLITKSLFLPWYDTRKKCCFSSLTFLSSTTSFKCKFVLVLSNYCSLCSSWYCFSICLMTYLGLFWIIILMKSSFPDISIFSNLQLNKQ